MNESDGLIYAVRLDRTGGGAPLDWNQIRAGSPQADAPLWLHFDYSAPRVRSWLLEESGLDPVVAEALLSGETRPRVAPGRPGGHGARRREPRTAAEARGPAPPGHRPAALPGPAARGALAADERARGLARGLPPIAPARGRGPHRATWRISTPHATGRRSPRRS